MTDMQHDHDPFDFEVPPPAGPLYPSTCGVSVAASNNLITERFEKPQRDWSDEQIRDNLHRRGFDREAQTRYLNKWHEVRGEKTQCKR